MRRQRTVRNYVLRNIRFGAAVVLSVLPSAANGRTQDGFVYAGFTPATQIGQQKLDARSAPARATTDDEAALVSKGYVMIGTVQAWLYVNKISAEITRRLDAAALNQAAKAGGDLVRFESEGTSHRSDYVQFKTRCTNTSTWTSYETTASGAEYERKEERCIKSESEEAGTKTKKDGFMSQGTVWRFDASLSATAKLNHAEVTSTLNPDALVRFIGKNINDPELHAWVAKLNARAEPVLPSNNFTVYDCQPLGMGLWFLANGNLFGIQLSSGTGLSKYLGQYQGTLPLGLSFQLSRRAVESKLGSPTVQKYTKSYSESYTLGTLKVELQYNNNNIKKIEPDAMLGEVTISGIP